MLRPGPRRTGGQDLAKSDEDAIELVNIHDAKTHLSRLIERVRKGEEIVIAKGGKPVARLVGVTQTAKPRTPGRLKGRIRVAKDFDASLPEDVLRLFEGKRAES